VGEIHLVERLGRTKQHVRMRIDHSGCHGPTRQIDHFRPGSDELRNVSVRAHGLNFAIQNRNGSQGAILLVHCQHGSVTKYQIRWRRLYLARHRDGERGPTCDA
jgi:hypothetical protein